MQEKFPHTVVQCLAAIAQHHGVQINPERLVEDYALGSSEPNGPLLLRMASELGFKAKVATITWDDLVAQDGKISVKDGSKSLDWKDACRKLGTKPTFVFASSLAVFGNLPGQPLPEEEE